MNVLRRIGSHAAQGVDMADSLEGLATIHRADCAAAIWPRRTLPEFQTWIDALAPDQLPRGRVILKSHAVRDAMQQMCAAAGTPEGAHQTRLIDDVAALADLFSAQMASPWLRFRLDVVTTNACRKFHIDAVMARLICTYRGTGTQYGLSKDEQDPPRVFTTPIGAPIVLRGTLWPNRPSSGLRHRSPPIEGTDETRLLLVLDPVRGPEDDL